MRQGDVADGMNYQWFAITRVPGRELKLDTGFYEIVTYPLG